MNSQPPSCKIILYGPLNERWIDYLGNMLQDMKVEDGQIQTTTLTGQPPDLLAYIGMLNAIAHLRMTVIAAEFYQSIPVDARVSNVTEPALG